MRYVKRKRNKPDDKAIGDALRRAVAVGNRVIRQAVTIQRLTEEVRRLKAENCSLHVDWQRELAELARLRAENVRLMAYVSQVCPRCDDCRELLIDGGIVEADGIVKKPCRVGCQACHTKGKEEQA